MNANVQSAAAFNAAAARPVIAVSASRREHRVRDFGIGYGSSSGYFSQRRYAGHSIAPRFRCS